MTPIIFAFVFISAFIPAAVEAQRGWVKSKVGESCFEACAGKEPCSTQANQRVTSYNAFTVFSIGVGVSKTCPEGSRLSTPVSYAPAYGPQGNPCLFNGVNSNCGAKKAGHSRLCCCSNSACLPTTTSSTTTTTTML